MGRSRQRADRIRALIPIEEVLLHYGYQVRADAGGREQQFCCDLHGDGQDTKPSARVYPESASWYCVDVNERVLTSRGWLKLSDVRRTMQNRCWRDWEYLGMYPDSCGPRAYACLRCGTQVTVQSGDELDQQIDAHICQQPWKIVGFPGFKVLDGKSTWVHPTAYLRRSKRPVVRVKTKAGYSVSVTPDHEIEVVGRGWVQAQNIHQGDVLVVPKPSTPKFSQVYDLPVGTLNEQTYHNHPQLNLPTRWTTDLGECLGYVFGDGWVVPREAPASGVVGLTAHADDAADARRVFQTMQGWAGGWGSEIHRTNVAVTPNGQEYTQDQYVFTIGNDGFCEFFRRMGLDKLDAANERRLPESIWQAPEEGVRGFLRGMYATDGSVFRPTGRKGIKVNLYSVSGEFLRDVQLLLLQFGIHSRVHSPSKTNTNGKLTHPCWYLQLATGLDILAFRERIGIANERKQEVLDSYCYNPRGSRPFLPVVESVTLVGTALVADLSMPKEHSFVAGGIKVHNCFACDKTRDAIGTVQAKEGCDFWVAVKKLEKQFDLPPLQIDDEVEYTPQTTKQIVADSLATLDPQRTFEDDVKRFGDLLRGICEPPSQLPMNPALSFWEALDKVIFQVRGPKGEGGEWSEQKGRAALEALRLRVLELLKAPK